MGSFSGVSLVNLGVGSLASLGTLAGLAAAFVRPTRSCRLSFSAMGMLLVLATLAATWLTYLHDLGLMSAAAVHVAPASRSESGLRGSASR